MKYIHTSRRWIKDYGLGERNIIGLSHYEVFPEIPARWREIHQRCLSGAIEKCDEDPFTRLGGKIDWVRWEIHPWRDNNGNIGGIIIFTEVITERKRVEEVLKKSNQRLDLLAGTASMLLESDSPQEVIDSLCRKVLAFLNCDAFFNYIVDYDKQRLHLNACGGIPDIDVRKMEWLDYGEGLCGCSARDGSRLVVENLQDIEDQYTALVRPFGIQAYACHPLISQGRVIGTLSFCTRTKSHFTDDELSIMKSVADQVAIAIDRKLSTELMSRSKKKFREIFENARDAISSWEDSSFLNPGGGTVQMRKDKIF
jgi:PAS domain S-box-containing protein